MLEVILYVLLEALLSALVIMWVPYTEIDWSTYMQHIRLFLRGERLYSQLTGPTGPAVYPAGYIWSFTVLYFLTRGGNDISSGQWAFYAIYLVQCILAAVIFTSCKIKPRWTILFMILSKRLHSIYMLRLFNDCVMVLLMFMAVTRLLNRGFMSATILWSMAVSVKMSALLYGPAWGIIVVRECGWVMAVEMACWFGLVQGFLAVPFLRRSWREYFTMAFDFSRSFDYKWTVNWRFLSESVFSSLQWKVTLLVCHVATIALFAHYRWLRQHGGILSLLNSASPTRWSPRKMTIVLMECNLIGVLFARSLHYQHYGWYYHSVWMLAMMGKRETWPLAVRVLLCLCVEYCWNVYPSTTASSLLLFSANVAILLMPRDE